MKANRFRNLAAELRTDQFFMQMMREGRNPASVYDDGFIWIDNGADFDDQEYAVFCWERQGFEFVFKGQVRLMGSEDKV